MSAVIRLGSFGFLRFGRDFISDRGAEIAIGLIRRKDAQEGEIAFRFYGYINWDWLPPRLYEIIAPAEGEWCVSAARWTGRRIAFRGFDWKRWYAPRVFWNFI